jgi:hypothetical protein
MTFVIRMLLAIYMVMLITWNSMWATPTARSLDVIEFFYSAHRLVYKRSLPCPLRMGHVLHVGTRYAPLLSIPSSNLKNVR